MIVIITLTFQLSAQVSCSRKPSLTPIWVRPPSLGSLISALLILSCHHLETSLSPHWTGSPRKTASNLWSSVPNTTRHGARHRAGTRAG